MFINFHYQSVINKIEYVLLQVVETLEGVFPQADPAPQPNGGYSIESLPSDMPVNIMAEQKTTDMPVEIMAEQKPIENEASGINARILMEIFRLRVNINNNLNTFYGQEIKYNIKNTMKYNIG